MKRNIKMCRWNPPVSRFLNNSSTVSLVAILFFTNDDRKKTRNLKNLYDDIVLSGNILWSYTVSGALRGTFWEEQKTQSICKLSDLIKQRQDHQKPRSLRFSPHKFVHFKYFWTLFKNVHSQGLCSLRLCISRPYLLYSHHSNA